MNTETLTIKQQNILIQAILRYDLELRKYSHEFGPDDPVYEIINDRLTTTKEVWEWACKLTSKL